MWQLIINGPGYFDTFYQLPEGVTALGRSEENDIVLSGDLVSRRHARLTLTKGKLTVQDAGSRNGCKVNGTQISAPVELKVGDIVSVGENSLAVREVSAAEASHTDLLDVEGSPVRAVDEKAGAVLLTRNVRESFVRRALDNVNFSAVPLMPFEVQDESAKVRNAHGETLETLYRISEKLVHSNSLQAFLDEAVDRVMVRAGAVTAVVLLRNNQGALVPTVVRHNGKLEKGQVPVSTAIISEVLRTGNSLVVRNAKEDERFASRQSVVRYGAEQVICIPLGGRAPFRGALYLNTRPPSPTDLDSLVDLCTAIGHLIVSAVDGVQARGTGEERLRRVLERAHPPDVVERKISLARSGTPPLGLAPSKATVLLAEIVLPLDVAARAGPLLESFHQKVAGLIFSFDGSIEAVKGTGIRAVFGAPFEKPDDALRAMRAAQALRSEWTRLCVASKMLTHLKMSLATGACLAGVVGCLRHDYVVSGEAPAVADALLGLARPGDTLVDLTTADALASPKSLEFVGDVLFESLERRMRVHRLIAVDTAASTYPGTGTGS